MKEHCPNCKRPNPAIEKMPDGSCGVCGGTGEIEWKAVGKIVPATPQENGGGVKELLEDQLPYTTQVIKERIGELRYADLLENISTLLSISYHQGLKEGREARDRELREYVENKKYTGFHKECVEGMAEGCDDCFYRQQCNAQLDLILAFLADDKPQGDE